MIINSEQSRQIRRDLAKEEIRYSFNTVILNMTKEIKDKIKNFIREQKTVEKYMDIEMKNIGIKMKTLQISLMINQIQLNSVNRKLGENIARMK